MLADNQELVQLLNTAVVKTKEKKIDSSYEERLSEVCQSSAMKSLAVAISHLSDTQKISRDQAAMEIVETIRELDSIWSDYVMMEGLTKLKDVLRGTSHH